MPKLTSAMKTQHSFVTRGAWLALGALLIGGCQSTPTVKTEAKTGADFSRYKTFAILPLPQSGPPSDPGLMLRIADPVRRAVVDALTAKGFQEAPIESADFSVYLHGQFVPKVDVSQYGYSRTVLTRYGTMQVVTNPDVDVREYEERTLTINILDKASKDTVWMGWSSAERQGPVKVEKVTEAIHQILAKFPPEPGAAATP